MLTQPQARGVGLRHLWGLLLVGAVGLLLDGHGVAGWADSLPDGFGPMRDAAQWWGRQTDRLGLDAPYDTLHRWVRDAVAAPF